MTTAWKRIFSLVLVLCLLLGVAPVQALALTPEDFTDNRNDMVLQLRKGLTAYESEIVLHHKTVAPVTEQYAKNLFTDAIAKESVLGGDTAYSGDYLLLSVSNVDIRVEYTVQDVHYYNQITYGVTYINDAPRETQLRETVKALVNAMGNETYNDYQRCKYIYDYLRSGGFDGSDDNKTALFYAMAVSSGMDCRAMVGTVDGKAHSWNIVKIYNKWYAVDVARGEFLKGKDFLDSCTLDAFYTSDSFTKLHTLSDTAFDPANAGAGTMEKGFSWRYDAAEAALIISGQGPMQDFVLQSFSGIQTVTRPWAAYVTEGASYVVEEGVTALGSYAFYGVLFHEIKLPSTLQAIGEGAFQASRGLTVTLPEGVSVIPRDAFKDAQMMQVNLPNSVTAIGDRAFSGCMRLDELQLPAGVKSVGEAVTEGCRSLRKVLFLGDEAAWQAVAVGGNNAKLREVLRSGSGGFFDVPEGEWFYAPVNWAAERNITGGIGNGRFGALEGCTRAQVVTFLWAAKGRPEPKSADNPFTDVAGDAWYLKPVLWAVENGITTGVSETEFAPDRSCTRGQIVTFLYAAEEKPEVSGENPFEDVVESDWFLNPVLWAVGEGITSGIAEGKFGPNDVCTRAQVVTFLYKAFGSN